MVIILPNHTNVEKLRVKDIFNLAASFRRSKSIFILGVMELTLKHIYWNCFVMFSKYYFLNIPVRILAKRQF